MMEVRMPSGRSGGKSVTVRVAARTGLTLFVIYGAWVTTRAFWQRENVERDVARAYEFVIVHPEVSSYLPCFCGCGKREGHSSLDSCFVSRRDAAGRMIARDPHAESCKVCVNVALDASRMIRAGVRLPEIRRRVESTYGVERSLWTDTPPPPQTSHAPGDHRAQ
jgi:hypothetical protein